MQQENTKEVITVIQQIPASTSVTIKERVKAAGTVEEIRVRFYPGPQGDLRVRPYIQHKGDRVEALVNYAGTDQHLSGDDDYFVLPVIKSVEYDDYIHIEAQNVDTVNAYTLCLFIVVDYFAGKNRVIGGVAGV